MKQVTQDDLRPLYLKCVLYDPTTDRMKETLQFNADKNQTIQDCVKNMIQYKQRTYIHTYVQCTCTHIVIVI